MPLGHICLDFNKDFKRKVMILDSDAKALNLDSGVSGSEVVSIQLNSDRNVLIVDSHTSG